MVHNDIRKHGDETGKLMFNSNVVILQYKHMHIILELQEMVVWIRNCAETVQWLWRLDAEVRKVASIGELHHRMKQSGLQYNLSWPCLCDARVRDYNVIKGDHKSREKGDPLISVVIILVLYLYSDRQSRAVTLAQQCIRKAEFYPHHPTSFNNCDFCCCCSFSTLIQCLTCVFSLVDVPTHLADY